MAKNSKGNLGQVSKYNIVDAGDAIIWLKLQTRGFVIAKCQKLVVKFITSFLGSY
jgi:hypothetical protein